ncbi:MAG: xanthine dehydrogenase family protein subunit M [Anaerolineales bacterium]|nr:xanthine dehydrogenase family protein subunit M [Anaerolineales bacterium]
MRLWNDYHTPTSIEEALQLLAHYQGRARLVAGGTDLLVEIREGRHAPQDALVDVTHIPEMTTHHQEADGTIWLGAAVTHSHIVQSALLTQAATCLVESCGVVGGPQVRNVGTIGGNVAHALPAGDGTTSLVALDATARVVLDGQEQWVPIEQMFKGPGQSLLDPTRDILIGFRFKASGTHEASAFKRIMRPQGVALPILGCAVWVRLTDGQIADARISIAPIGPTPARATVVEEALRGQPANPASIEQAIAVANEALHPRTSKYRATAPYRQEMIAVLLRRTLPLAIDRARTGQAIPEGIGA